MSVNYFIGNTTVDIALTDEVGNAVLVKCTVANIPSGKPHYAKGCDLIASDTGNHYFNKGTETSSNFQIVDTGVSGITALTGDVTASGSGSVATTIQKLKGGLINASVATPFTNEVFQWSGNPAVGWVNAAHQVGTAVAGSVTFSGQNGTNIIVTTEALTTAAGATYALTVISAELTSSSNILTDVTYGTATTGIPKVVKKVQAGGSCTFTIENIDPLVAFNGTLIFNMFAF